MFVRKSNPIFKPLVESILKFSDTLLDCIFEIVLQILSTAWVFRDNFPDLLELIFADLCKLGSDVLQVVVEHILDLLWGDSIFDLGRASWWIAFLDPGLQLLEFVVERCHLGVKFLELLSDLLLKSSNSQFVFKGGTLDWLNLETDHVLQPAVTALVHPDQFGKLALPATLTWCKVDWLNTE